MSAQTFHRLEVELNNRKHSKNLRVLTVQQSYTDFSSNDYLGFSHNQDLKDEILAASKSHSLGSTGSRLLSGNCSLADSIEKKIAQLFHAEKALLFNSGYNANLGLLQALCSKKEDVILLDELAHASLKDGMRLSRAKGYYFRHNNLEHLEEKLKRLTKEKNSGQCFVGIESVYSMDGDLAPLEEIAHLCDTYGALLIVDEAHGLGTIGKWGEGLVVSKNLQDKVFARTYTFGKALGCHGAAILGQSTLINYLINFCHSFIYTTAMPSHSLLNISFALKNLSENSDSYLKLKERTKQFNSLLNIKNHESPIYSLVFEDTNELLKICNDLKNKKINVYPILSPTVKRKSERLRIVLHAFNTKDECIKLLEVLNKYGHQWQKYFYNRY